jgi:SAM-dependent methyltransferase
MKDPRERFTGTADNYEKYRPSYPPELIDWIVATSGVEPGARIADLGCGTGISTRLFASRGFDVVGIDPNPEMLLRAERAGGASYRKGEASATGLEDRSVDLIVGGQAFHWFDLDQVFREFRRILKPGRWCAAFWNIRSRSSPFLDEYDAILRRHSSEYGTLVADEDLVPRIRNSPGIMEPREVEFTNRQAFDREGFLGRAWSSSYVVHGVKDRVPFDAALNDLFDRHQRGGSVEFLYSSVAIAWRLEA